MSGVAILRTRSDATGLKRPAPFTKTLHKLEDLGAACEWLGVESPT